VTLLDHQQQHRPIEPPDPHRVHDLYASRFVDRYDLGAELWERLTCGDALAAFEHRLRSLPKRSLRVLDVGCGTGRNLHRLAAAGIDIDNYVGVDTSERMLQRAATNHPYSRARFVSGDAIDTLGSEGKHDLIVITWVLSHHPDPAALIAAATNALAPEGRVLILALTASDTIMGRLHAWRLRRFLHSNPIDPVILRESSPSFLGVSCRGLITIAEIPRR
jgi:2-polyprenyl-3-methyl-5-hydroxy-6-metoxy-1,4-benzoquinol methylase